MEMCGMGEGEGKAEETFERGETKEQQQEKEGLMEGDRWTLQR